MNISVLEINYRIVFSRYSHFFSCTCVYLRKICCLYIKYIFIYNITCNDINLRMSFIGRYVYTYNEFVVVTEASTVPPFRGLLKVLMVVWRCVQGGCGVFFQTCNRINSDRLPVVGSPRCWGWCLVVDDLFQTFLH